MGTDDGNIHVTRNEGATWTNVRLNIQGVPAGEWITGVEASHFVEGRAYVTIDGHRSGDFKPHVFRTEDFGKTWTNIASNLPDGHVADVIREDYKNPNLLFLGTEFAVYVSLNGGARWERFMNNLPTTPVYDLVIHPRDADLVAATHGRSIWIADDITALQQFTPEVAAKDVHLFASRPAVRWLEISRGGSRGMFYFHGENPAPGTAIHFYLRNAPPSEVTVAISNIDGSLKRTARIKAAAGINRFQWDMRFNAPAVPAIAPAGRSAAVGQTATRGGGGRRRGAPGGPMAEPGLYKVTLTVEGKTYENTVAVRQDPLKGK